MKIKYLMLISLMLVILTVGVVSASDDVLSDVNLTTSDNAISDEGIVFDDENIGSGDDALSIGEESIASNDEREDAIEIDIHGYDKSMKNWTNTELSNNSYFAEISAPDDATGNVTVFVDSVQCFKKDISDCPVLHDDLYCIGPYDLDYDFDMGKYHVVVLYEGDDKYLPNYKSNTIRIVEENYVSPGQDAVDIYIWGGYYEIDEYWGIGFGDDEIAFIDAPDDATGNVTVFVNGTQCFKEDISNIDKDDGLYSILLNDLDYEFLPGNYSVKIVYDGNRKYSPFSEEDVIEMVGEFPEESKFFNINDKVCLADDDEIAYIDAPDNATGNVTVFVDGTQCFKKDISNINVDEFGFYSILLSDLDYEFLPGNYSVKMVYDGDEYYSPTAESKEIIIVAEDYDDGDDERNAVEIIIYESFSLDDYDDIASISAPDNATGNITVFVDGTQCFKEDISNLDKDSYDVYCISLYDLDYEFSPGEYFVKIVYSGDEHYPQIVENKTISILGENCHDEVEIVIFGCGKDVRFWSYVELDDDEFARISAPDDATGNVTIFVDGVQCFKKGMSNLDMDGYGDWRISLEDIDYDFSLGTYFVEIIYEGDENYPPISESNLIRVVENGYDNYGPEAAAIVIYVYEDTKLDGEDVFAAIHAPKGITGSVTVFINGTQCFKEDISGRISDSGYYRDVYRIGPQDVDYAFSSGKYLVEVVYDGDDYYRPTSESGIITIIEDNSNNGDANPSGGTASPVTKNPVQASVKKDTVKLALKKVKVKRSAKKLVLQATLKINNKAKKGLKVTFKFNGKKFTAKTNKKGIAKVTIKKKLLKKLKIGKKVKIQVSYGKTTKNMIVKIKK